MIGAGCVIETLGSWPSNLWSLQATVSKAPLRFRNRKQKGTHAQTLTNPQESFNPFQDRSIWTKASSWQPAHSSFRTLPRSANILPGKSDANTKGIATRSDRTLLGAPGLTTRSKRTLLGTKGISTRNKKLLGEKGLLRNIARASKLLVTSSS